MSNYPRGGGPGGGGNYATPLRTPGIYFDDIGRAWTMITKNPSVYIVGGIVILLAAAVVVVPLSILSNILMYGTAVPGPDAKMNLGMYPAMLALNMVAGGFNAALMSGIALAAIEEADTGSTRFETLFSGFRNFGNLIVGSIAYSIAVTVGAICCIVPGIYLAGALAFTNLAVILFGLPGIEGLKKSYEMLKPYAWSMFALLLVSGCVSGLGLILCCFGIFVTWPIQQVVLGLHFRDFRG
ncbi:MAG: hypothetical protein WCK51_10450 [Armatimonadota bacterium]